MRMYRNVQNSGNLSIVAIGGGTSSGQTDFFIVNTMNDIIINRSRFKNKHVSTLGYYAKNDGGGATYYVSNESKAGSISLGGGLYANITLTNPVNYRMFGAKLDLSMDDTENIKKCHLYADSVFTRDSNNCKIFPIWVKNPNGTIRVSEPIYCSSNVDLSGSTLIIDDVSAGWFGSYVWGQNASEYYSYNFNDILRASLKEGAYRLEGLEQFPENTVMHLKETHYEIRDDDGYLYDVDKGELMVHKSGGICSTPLGSDWTKAGGTLIYNDIEDEFLTTELIVEYTFIPTVHREFIGCEVLFQGSANNYCSVIWVKGHNCTVRDFTFRPELEVQSNTAFKNAMIYVWGSYKVKIVNCNGFNASGRISETVPTPTSGYAIRAFQTCDLVIEDCNIVGIWGSISVSSTKNCYLSRVTCNRIDVHDYIVNLFVNACIVFTHMFQIGYGSGICAISDSIFYYQHLPEERYPTPYLFALQTGYGRIFNGKISISNCKMIFLTKDTPKEFTLVWARFRPDARSVESKYRFPDITIKDFTIDTVQSDNLSIRVFGFRGQTKNKTSATIPPVTSHIAFSGETKWSRVIKTRNFTDGVYYYEGEVIRRMQRYLDSKGKTVFHSIEYYYVLLEGKMHYVDGTIKVKRIPLDPDTNEPIIDPVTGLPATEEIIDDSVQATKRIYAPYYMTGANYSTVQGQNFVVSIGSKFFPEEVFTGNVGSKTAGHFPNHTTGIVWYGDAYGDGIYLEREATNVTVNDWRPNMSFTTGQYFTVETKVFQCVSGGQTNARLVENVEWLKETIWGTARVKYVGSLWVQGAWIPQDGIILTYANPGYHGADFKYHRYRAKNKGGRNLYDNLLSISGIMLDGGITWERTSASASGTWSANTEYNINDVIAINGVAHRCIANSTMEMPKRITVSNIVHNSTLNPYLFYFESDIGVKVKNTTKFIVDTFDEFQGISFANRPFFGLTSNPEPQFAEIEESYADTEIIYNVYNFTIGTFRWSYTNIARTSPNRVIGRLDITNNNSFIVNYVIYESYNYGAFTWTLMKTISLNPNQTTSEFVQLSGTRNDILLQTRNATTTIDAPNSIVTLTFSNKTNVTTPTIILP